MAARRDDVRALIERAVDAHARLGPAEVEMTTVASMPDRHPVTQLTRTRRNDTTHFARYEACPVPALEGCGNRRVLCDGNRLFVDGSTMLGSDRDLPLTGLTGPPPDALSDLGLVAPVLRMLERQLAVDSSALLGATVIEEDVEGARGHRLTWNALRIDIDDEAVNRLEYVTVCENGLIRKVKLTAHGGFSVTQTVRYRPRSEPFPPEAFVP